MITDHKNVRLLPSQANVVKLVNGDTKKATIAWAIRDWLGRAAIISCGIYIAGGRENVIKYGIAGATAVDVFVLLHTLCHNGNCDPNLVNGEICYEKRTVCKVEARTE